MRRHRRCERTIHAAVLAGLSSVAVTASAADVFWDGQTSTDWNTPTNWNPDNVPATPDDAIVNLTPANIATISANLAATPRDIFVGREAGSNGRVNHTAGTAGTGDGNWMFVGARAGGTGTYNLADTAAVGGTLTGFGLGTGSLNVGGNNATAGRLYVGGDHVGTGTGTFNVNTQGTLKIGNDLGIGSAGGTGVMNVDAGTITTAGWNFIGKNEVTGGGNGTLNMSGGVLQNTGRTYVGQSNTTGKLILTGGTYNNNNNEQFIVGEAAGSNGLVEVKNAASTLKSGGELWIGQAAGGNGTLNVTAGAVTVNNWFVAGRDGATGVINLSGGSITKTGGGAIPIGTNTGGNGTINVSGTGSFVVAEPNFPNNPADPADLNNFNNDLILGELSNGNGTVVQTGGTVTLGGDLRLAGKLPTEVGGAGTYSLQGGTLDMTAGAIIPGGGTATFAFTGGTLKNAATIGVLVNQTGGTMSPGAPVGTTVINAPYSLGAGGTYLAELNPDSTSDLIDVNSAVSLAGTLDLSPLGTLTPGQTFTVMNYDSLIGTFAGRADDSTFTEDGYSFMINYNAPGNAVTVTVVPEPASIGLLAVGAAGVLLRRRRTV